MKVSDILQVKGSALYTVAPDSPLQTAILVMSEHDIGSLVVMDFEKLIGILTFREVIKTLALHRGTVDGLTVRSVMSAQPLTCSMDTELDEVRRIMLTQHARYLPVMSNRQLMGVVSFYDVAKAVVDSQNFENRMLKAYIRDWPAGEDANPTAQL